MSSPLVFEGLVRALHGNMRAGCERAFGCPNFIERRSKRNVGSDILATSPQEVG